MRRVRARRLLPPLSRRVTRRQPSDDDVKLMECVSLYSNIDVHQEMSMCFFSSNTTLVRPRDVARRVRRRLTRRRVAGLLSRRGCFGGAF